MQHIHPVHTTTVTENSVLGAVTMNKANTH